MQLKVNCIFAANGNKCTCTKVKRKFYQFTRSCVEYTHGTKCIHKINSVKPSINLKK